MFKTRKKRELLAEIEEGFTDEKVYLSRIVGMDILLALLEYGENLKVIAVPSSVYDQTSERVKSYIEKARVNFEKGSERVGRPPMYSDEDVQKIVKMRNKGVPIAEISRKLDIPRRTIYYLLEKKEI